MTLNDVLVFLRKVGTILIDRRAMIVAAFVAFITLIFPQMADQATNLEPDIRQAIELIIQGATILVGMFKLISSWTERPPSGQNYNEAATSKLVENEVRSRLRDLGLDV